MRVMTWNIKGAQLASVERIAAQIREVDADVVALQELFFDAQWNGHVDVAAELERLTGMHSARLITLEHVGPFGFEIAGQMVLTREPVELEPVVLASGRSVGAHFLFRGAKFVMFHLPTEVADRDEGLALLSAQTWNVALGDFNTEDVSGLSATQSECGPTFPADEAVRQIDWVLTREFAAGTCSTIATTASDHRPLVMSFGTADAVLANEIDGALFATSTFVRAAFVDRRAGPLRGLKGTFNGGSTGLCETRHDGVYEPCDALMRDTVSVELSSGATLVATATATRPVSIESVDSVAGAARFIALESLPHLTPPERTSVVPTHPLNRRVDVRLNGGDSLSVAVSRRVWNGTNYEGLESRFSTVPTTSKDLLDEVALPRTHVSVPGTTFDAPGLYFVTSVPLSAGSVTGLGAHSGALVGREQVIELWVE